MRFFLISCRRTAVNIECNNVGLKTNSLPNIDTKLGKAEKDILKQIIDETLEWIEEEKREKEAYDSKKEDVEMVVKPIISAVYK